MDLIRIEKKQPLPIKPDGWQITDAEKFIDENYRLVTKLTFEIVQACWLVYVDLNAQGKRTDLVRNSTKLTWKQWCKPRVSYTNLLEHFKSYGWIESRRKQIKFDFNKPVNTVNKSIQVHFGNCIDILPNLPVNSVDLLLTDPPYGMEFKSGWNVKDKIHNDTIKNTTEVLNSALMEAAKVMKPDAHFYIFGHIKFIEDIKPIIENHFTLKDILIWDRGVIGMGDLKSYGPTYDIIYFGYNKEWKGLNGIRDRNILEFKRVPPNNLIHPTEKPQDLLQYLIKKSTNENETVLDPFAGGGSSLVSASLLNRKSIGIELNEEYFNLIKTRI